MSNISLLSVVVTSYYAIGLISPLQAGNLDPIKAKVSRSTTESFDTLTRCAGLYSYEIAILSNRKKVNRYKVQQAKQKSIAMLAFADLIEVNEGSLNNSKREKKVAKALDEHLNAYLQNTPLNAALSQYPWLGASLEGRDKMLCNSIVKKYSR